jgi:DNA-binding NarL/FixJ family response regulator
MNRILVAVRAADPLSRAGVVSQLRSRPEVELVADVAAATADVFVVVTDILNAATMEQLRHLATTGATRFVLIVSALGNVDPLSLVEVGVVGVLRRDDADADGLLRVITTAATGGVHLPPDLQQRIVTDIARLQRTVLAARRLTAAGLDERELDVLRFLAEGLDVAEIAQKMLYSERTIKGILYNVTGRLNLRNRVHAVAYAIRAGVL